MLICFDCIMDYMLSCFHRARSFAIVWGLGCGFCGLGCVDVLLG